MGKKNKGKKQGQDNSEQHQNEDIGSVPAEHIINDQEILENSAVLIQPNQHQQKIIEELLKDEDGENNNKEEDLKEKKPEEETQNNKDTDSLSDVQIIQKQSDLIEVEDKNQIQETNNQQFTTPLSDSIQQQFNSQQQSQTQNLNATVEITSQSTQDQSQLQQQEEVRFVVDIFDQARAGNILPWAYAVDNQLINPLQFDNEGFHLIHRASMYNQIDAVHSLIQKHKVPVDLRDKTHQQTPLIIASKYGHFKLMKYLVDMGANVSACDSDQFTPVQNTVMNRFKLQTIYLMSKGADLTALDQHNCNIAHRAAFNNDVPMLQIINQVAKSLFEQKDKFNLAPVGRAITNDSHQAFQYLQRTSPIPVPDKFYNTMPNKCMGNMIKVEYQKQNIPFFSKQWLLNCYKSRPKDLCIFMYAIMIGTLYYHFVLQTGILYHKSIQHYYFCNVIHGLTAFLMTYIFIFVLKSECPSQNLKLGLHNGVKNINFRKLDISKVDFQHLDRLFGYGGKDETGDEIDEEDDEQLHQQQDNRLNSQKKCQPPKRTRLNFLDYVAILVENNKFSELKKFNDNNVCYECLDIKENRQHHCDKFGFCVQNFSHFSVVFDKLIVRGTNSGKYYLIISLQWVLLVLFFVANYLYCSTKYSFQGSFIWTFAEIPFIYYNNSEWKYLAIYAFACILYYLASLYFFIETFGLIMNLTRYEIFYPNRCHYFYPSKNIQEITLGRAYGPQSGGSTFFKYYENPYSNCKKRQ
ncbi:DHHC palmitoyltransferase (macronuclear) [Tetrahymena thermophila SB210]|uniref:Palmitoyltransferase n=1 Tax=Tetrahymena thermophila (strain SB210) TaxID=312017 RepID=Q22XV4_TETTS|nr:DHHC palmitoyltransferase [Tetrahymena thermophila SB210]EAR90067.1 DHHC palmitoyltransferase [Tetrahymena thermophila SB210]|eukprot:XP_001010312.1 DHHC palmitoyltransferase [Tetrahymena thermophila SB210]